MSTITKSASLVVLFILATVIEVEASALTEDFRLGDNSCEYQCGASVAVGVKRIFVIGGATEIDSDDEGIFTQTFGLDGVPNGGPFRLNMYTDGLQSPGDIKFAGEKLFATWSSEGQDGSGYAVIGARIGSDGMPVGSERILSESILGDQWAAQIAGVENGHHLVVWGDTDKKILARIFDGDNEPLTGEFEVPVSGELTTGGFGVASNGLDRFVICWKVRDPLTEKHGLRFRLLDVSGNFLGLERSYETETTVFWSGISIAMNRDGEFAVAWDPGDPFSINPIIVMQRFDENANAIGDLMILSEDDTEIQQSPSIAMTEDGHALVAWVFSSHTGPDYAINHSEIVAVWLDPDGNKIGDIFQVNESTAWAQKFPRADVNSDGVAAIVWTTVEEDVGRYSLWGRLFQYDGDDLGTDEDDDEDDDASDDSGDDDDDGCGC